MIIQNENIINTFYNIITFCLQFLVWNSGFLAILFLIIYFAWLLFKTFTFQK